MTWVGMLIAFHLVTSLDADILKQENVGPRTLM